MIYTRILEPSSKRSSYAVASEFLEMAARLVYLKSVSLLPVYTEAEELKKQHNIDVDKRKIVLNETIKNVGTYTATCKLGYEINAPLTVKIEEL